MIGSRVQSALPPGGVAHSTPSSSSGRRAQMDLLFSVRLNRSRQQLQQPACGGTRAGLRAAAEGRVGRG